MCLNRQIANSRDVNAYIYAYKAFFKSKGHKVKWLVASEGFYYTASANIDGKYQSQSTFHSKL
jgi:hypothetical protein